MYIENESVVLTSNGFLTYLKISTPGTDAAL